MYGQYRVAELVEVAFADRSHDRFGSTGDRQYGHFQTDSGLLALRVDHRVTVDTGLVDGLVIPYKRQLVRADRYGVVEQTVDGQLQLNDTVATERRGVAERIAAGSLVVLAEELNRVALEDRVVNHIVVCTEYIEVQYDDAVTTDTVDERVAVLAAFRQVTSVERIAVTLADFAVDSRVARLSYDQLQTVEQSLTVHNRGVVAVDAGCVEQGSNTCSRVIPLVRQVTCADGYHRINHRMNVELEYARAVATS